MEGSAEEYKVDVKEAFRVFSISKTECKYLPLLAEGKTKKNIADELNRSEATVISHVKNLQAKLDARNTTSLVARAMRKKILLMLLMGLLGIGQGDDEVNRLRTGSSSNFFRLPASARIKDA